jgi:hypothetical protein
MQKEIDKNVIIIGAGAAGLMCAAECGKRRRTVLVLDHAGRTASKVRISGGGRSNFTNLHATAEHYLSRNSHFCKSALARFSPSDMLSLVRKHGIAYVEKEGGQIFCRKSSREIADLLEDECKKGGVEIRLRSRIAGVRKEGAFIISTNLGVFRSESLVVATGGLSYSRLGASGFGHSLARQFGIRVTPVRPALVPFVFGPGQQRLFQGLAGISVDAVVQCGGKRFRGNILLTHRGVSGPAALQASLYWNPGEPILIDLLPETDILAVLLSRRQSKAELHNLLAGFLPKRFSQAWCRSMAEPKPVNQQSDKELKKIAAQLHAWEIVPKGTEGYQTAEVTAGGVDTDELSSRTMESRKVPGLFFVGEVMDVTGRLGGYNLHWAWASGHAAGQHA